ncbi:sulfotransferase family 2 domain-containing protein [Neptunicella sp. SCSIO 80796]|uniref:sulfotransferase family 2 domain-containing protein n=1 Tax=Neptunicella plasticusilytica TaxID=3117012 RepID=UPI003A4E54C3
MKSINFPFLFVHIPKTAGTSLRSALMKAYSDGILACDYGLEEKATTKDIRQFVYEDKDIYKLIEKGVKGIYGHFPTSKYLHLSHCNNVICFMRDPVERVISEFKHVQRIEGYEGTLEEFVAIPRIINSQSQFLKGLPWVSYGFIGVSEQYDTALSLLSHKLGRSLKTSKLNTADKHQKMNVSSEQRALIESLNNKDIKLYQQVIDKFEWRKKLSLAKELFMHGGWEYNRARKAINGFAYYDDSDSVVILEMYVNGQFYKCIEAKNYHAVMQRAGVARLGYVGFRCSMELNSADEITLVNVRTGQPLPKVA